MNAITNKNERLAPPASEAVEIAAYFDRLFPLLRSLTGAGVRQSLDILGELVDFDRLEIPSGTKVFDWTVPQEWVVREAYLEGPDGRRIIDMRDNNLHLLNYSTGFRGEVSREELDEHLHSRADMPDVIPYVTSYYKPRWGFCLPHRVREALPDGTISRHDRCRSYRRRDEPGRSGAQRRDSGRSADRFRHLPSLAWQRRIERTAGAGLPLSPDRVLAEAATDLSFRASP